MQTKLAEVYLQTAEGREAEAILRSCVHCGFCTATCPTYQLLGDERDGPRGRIYLIKQLLETDKVSEGTRNHLDRCLSCRSCETTCPSDVRYGRLLDIGRGVMEQKLPRPASARLLRRGLRWLLPYARRFGTAIALGRLFRPLLPRTLAAKIPSKREAQPWPTRRHRRVMLALAGCAQPGAAPNTNAAAARVLDRLGITLVEAPDAGCCGAVSYHLAAQEEGLSFMRRNIDAWWPAVAGGCEAIVMTASGCGAMVQEYGHLLRHDPAYAEKAARISALTKDISEVLLQEDLELLKATGAPAPRERIAVHCPCTLQHAMKQGQAVETVLKALGFTLAATREGHLCCGSTGTYSLLQPEISQQLLERKIEALTGDHPTQLVTANIGCQLQLETASPVPVRHWIELLDSYLPVGVGAPSRH